MAAELWAPRLMRFALKSRKNRSTILSLGALVGGKRTWKSKPSVSKALLQPTELSVDETLELGIDKQVICPNMATGLMRSIRPKFPKMNAPKWSLICPSCDRNSDLWPLFFHFLFLEWPEVPRPVHLITNFAVFEDASVNSVTVGPDVSWTENLKAALESIDSDYVVFLLDDFLQKGRVTHQQIQVLVEQLASVEGVYLNLKINQADGRKVEGTKLVHMTGFQPRAGFNEAIWSRKYLMEICSGRQNPWQCESSFRERARAHGEKLYCLDASETLPFNYVESVRGRFWKPEGVEFVRASGLNPDLNVRPCPPQGAGFWSKIIRSYYKRVMNRRAKSVEKDAVEGRRLRVMPLCEAESENRAMPPTRA